MTCTLGHTLLFKSTLWVRQSVVQITKNFCCKIQAMFFLDLGLRGKEVFMFQILPFSFPLFLSIWLSGCPPLSYLIHAPDGRSSRPLWRIPQFTVFHIEADKQWLRCVYVSCQLHTCKSVYLERFTSCFKSIHVRDWLCVERRFQRGGGYK